MKTKSLFKRFYSAPPKILSDARGAILVEVAFFCSVMFFSVIALSDIANIVSAETQLSNAVRTGSLYIIGNPTDSNASTDIQSVVTAASPLCASGACTLSVYVGSTTTNNSCYACYNGGSATISNGPLSLAAGAAVSPAPMCPGTDGSCTSTNGSPVTYYFIHGSYSVPLLLSGLGFVSSANCGGSPPASSYCINESVYAPISSSR